MSKPIFILELSNPPKTPMKLDEIAHHLQNKMMDYHTLIIPNHKDENRYFCFNAPHTDTEFDNLKEYVKNSLNEYFKNNECPE